MTEPTRAELDQALADAIVEQEEILERVRRRLHEIRSQIAMVSLPGGDSPITLAKRVEDILKHLRAQTSMSHVVRASFALQEHVADELKREHTEADDLLTGLSTIYREADPRTQSRLRQDLLVLWRTQGRRPALGIFLAQHAEDAEGRS